jgi:putative peptidoglycan lipid II flippase
VSSAPEAPDARTETASGHRRRGGALTVAVGILVSRVFGVARESIKTSYLGATSAGDAFSAAMRIPNMLQTLLGEGALSASFIPAYRRMLDRADPVAAGKLAGAVASAVALVAAIAVAIGVAAAPWLVSVLAVGFEGERYDLTVRLTRILFPGAGLFVIGAWCLGVQNSHHRLFLPYVAPVVWNVAMIAAFLSTGPSAPLDRVAVVAAWGSVVGAALQLAIQLPSVFRLARPLAFGIDRADPAFRRVVGQFGPVLISRGVVQISGFIDQAIASVLAIGSVALLASAQTVVMLPISLFGIAVSAAELPALSSDGESPAAAMEMRRQRLAARTRQVAFLVIPCAVAFLLLGDTIFRVLFERRQFTATDTMFGWGILAASALGLVATTQARLYTNVFHAGQDTRTPLRCALIRVALASVAGFTLARFGPRALGIDEHWGAAGLALGGGIGGVVELGLLRNAARRLTGPLTDTRRLTATLWTAAAVAGAIAFGVKTIAVDANALVEGGVVLGGFVLAYAGITLAMGIPEARDVLARIRRVR